MTWAPGAVSPRPSRERLHKRARGLSDAALDAGREPTQEPVHHNSASDSVKYETDQPMAHHAAGLGVMGHLLAAPQRAGNQIARPDKLPRPPGGPRCWFVRVSNSGHSDPSPVSRDDCSGHCSDRGMALYKRFGMVGGSGEPRHWVGLLKIEPRDLIFVWVSDEKCGPRPRLKGGFVGVARATSRAMLFSEFAAGHSELDRRVLLLGHDWHFIQEAAAGNPDAEERVVPVQWLNRAKAASWQQPYDQYYSTALHKELGHSVGLFSNIGTISDLDSPGLAESSKLKAEVTKRVVCEHFQIDLEAALSSPSAAAVPAPAYGAAEEGGGGGEGEGEGGEAAVAAAAALAWGAGTKRKREGGGLGGLLDGVDGAVAAASEA